MTAPLFLRNLRHAAAWNDSELVMNTNISFCADSEEFEVLPWEGFREVLTLLFFLSIHNG
jgi:hypothetical protein